MKKKALIAAIIFLLLVVVFGAVISIRNSPEYALLTIAREVEASGVEGLKPYLTGEVLEKVEQIETLTENKVVGAISSILNAEHYMERLKTELAKVEWELDDIRKSSGQARISLGFNYEEKLIGTVDFTMVRDNGAWKISEISLPELD